MGPFSIIVRPRFQTPPSCGRTPTYSPFWSAPLLSLEAGGQQAPPNPHPTLTHPTRSPRLISEGVVLLCLLMMPRISTCQVPPLCSEGNFTSGNREAGFEA